MKMIKAIIRPEKSAEVLAALAKAGFCAATRSNVLGRGKQQGLKLDTIHYDELAKDCISIVVEDEDEPKVTKILIDTATTGKSGAYGDGKIFVIPVETAYTISSGKEEL